MMGLGSAAAVMGLGSAIAMMGLGSATAAMVMVVGSTVGDDAGLAVLEIHWGCNIPFTTHKETWKLESKLLPK
ncbi:hypothetical protein Q3G72_019932 [Acer saccharum]|nr:hypothetical protein Q3G72_019932 [Acer saccharum]